MRPVELDTTAAEGLGAALLVSSCPLWGLEALVGKGGLKMKFRYDSKTVTPRSEVKVCVQKPVKI